jgi:hypothetical protein
MKVTTSSPRIYTDEHGLKHRELAEALVLRDNDKKIRVNPRASEGRNLA